MLRVSRLPREALDHECSCEIGFLFVGRRDGSRGLPTESEMRVLFDGFEIDSVRMPTDDEIKESRATRSVVVTFVKWGECGEALKVRSVIFA